MTIKAKLIATAMLIAVGIVALVATIGVTAERIRINGPVYLDIVREKDLIADILPPPAYILESYLVALQALSEKDVSKIPSHLDRLAGLRRDFEERHAYWGKELRRGKIRTLLLEASYRPAIAFYDGATKEFFPALMAGDHARAEKILTDTLLPAYDAHRKAINEIAAVANVESAELEKHAADLLRNSRIATVALGVAFFFVIVVIFFIIIRSITGQLQKVVSVANSIADGDLRGDVEVSSRDEIGQLMSDMKIMAGNLRTLIGQVTGTSSEVAAAAQQLNSAAFRIATDAEEIVSQAETIATAGEEMTTTSGDIARNSQMAAEGARRASQSAISGAAVVDKTVVVMEQIAAKVQESAKTVGSLGARSDQIGAIIGTIEDIADQTNLLALNAAIEAARAGEQGRGFAVVADEVRALAERTTRATREIGEMIKAIQNETRGAVAVMEQGVHQVEEGTTEAAKSGVALRDILEQINDVAMQINQIATAAEQQTATTGQISSNMQRITECVQQTSCGAQESATAATQLSGNADQLNRLVGQFRL